MALLPVMFGSEVVKSGCALKYCIKQLNAMYI